MSDRSRFHLRPWRLAPRLTPLLLALLLSSVALLAACTTEATDDDAGRPAAGSDGDAAAGAGAGAGEASPESPAASEGDESSAFPVTVPDPSGTEITIEAPAQRIVSYSPGATEILFAIGAGDAVVAADQFSDFPAEAESLPQVQYSDPDPEQALSFDPDLVVMADRQSEQVGQFRDLGMTVYFIQRADSIDAVLEDIDRLGRLTGQEAEATAVAEDMRSRIDELEQRVEDVEQGPRVFWELSPELHTVAPDTFIGGMLSLLKAQNIAAGAESDFPQLSNEVLIEANPEVILLTDAESAGQSLETLRERPGWDVITAVQQGRVYALDADLTNRPGPRIVEGIEEIAAALYPDRFE